MGSLVAMVVLSMPVHLRVGGLIEAWNCDQRAGDLERCTRNSERRFGVPVIRAVLGGHLVLLQLITVARGDVGDAVEGFRSRFEVSAVIGAEVV